MKYAKTSRPEFPLIEQMALTWQCTKLNLNLVLWRFESRIKCPLGSWRRSIFYFLFQLPRREWQEDQRDTKDAKFHASFDLAPSPFSSGAKLHSFSSNNTQTKTRRVILYVPPMKASFHAFHNLCFIFIADKRKSVIQTDWFKLRSQMGPSKKSGLMDLKIWAFQMGPKWKWAPMATELSFWPMVKERSTHPITRWVKWKKKKKNPSFWDLDVCWRGRSVFQKELTKHIPFCAVHALSHILLKCFLQFSTTLQNYGIFTIGGLLPSHSSKNTLDMRHFMCA